MCTLQVLAGIANLLALIPVMVAVVIAIKLRKAIWVALFISEILLVLYFFKCKRTRINHKRCVASNQRRDALV